MSFDYGPLRTYEITWRSGHIETVQGHQVTYTGGRDLLGHGPERPVRFRIHGMFDDQWRLTLAGLEDDVAVIRDVTDGERIAPEVGR
ncbi:hypothetical protein [Actinomadura nitritigenes]|uniref:hypothetical protein n=1 Tax=Actinomadura nitritigenes TaxID=134602 RepID=UPI003D89D77A